MANILDKMPKSVQKYAKEIIHEIYMAPRKTDGLKAFEKFLGTYESKYPKACECLKKDKDQLFSFYDFPGMHWQYIRTTNPIESTFATKSVSKSYEKKIYRKPGYCIDDIWRIDGLSLIWALKWNCGNPLLDEKGDIQMETTMRIRVPKQGTGAD